MANHFKQLDNFKDKLVNKKFNPKSQEQKDKILVFMMHLSDISNTAKPFEICKIWIESLFFEFFKQGDKERERNIPVSHLMDRETVNIATA